MSSASTTINDLYLGAARNKIGSPSTTRPRFMIPPLLGSTVQTGCTTFALLLGKRSSPSLPEGNS